MIIGQPEVEHRQVGVELLVEILRDTILLHPELDVFAVHLQVGFDDPVMAIRALALEQKRVRPRVPVLALIQVALGTADGSIHERDTAGKSNAPGPGVEFQKLPIR